VLPAIPELLYLLTARWRKKKKGEIEKVVSNGCGFFFSFSFLEGSSFFCPSILSIYLSLSLSQTHTHTHTHTHTPHSLPEKTNQEAAAGLRSESSSVSIQFSSLFLSLQNFAPSLATSL
jgi:hypothetical protein